MYNGHPRQWYHQINWHALSTRKILKLLLQMFLSMGKNIGYQNETQKQNTGHHPIRPQLIGYWFSFHPFLNGDMMHLCVKAVSTRLCSSAYSWSRYSIPGWQFSLISLQIYGFLCSRQVLYRVNLQPLRVQKLLSKWHYALSHKVFVHCSLQHI